MAHLRARLLAVTDPKARAAVLQLIELERRAYDLNNGRAAIGATAPDRDSQWSELNA
jgi:hypothetical protein